MSAAVWLRPLFALTTTSMVVALRPVSAGSGVGRPARAVDASHGHKSGLWFSPILSVICEILPPIGPFGFNSELLQRRVPPPTVRALSAKFRALSAKFQAQFRALSAQFRALSAKFRAPNCPSDLAAQLPAAPWRPPNRHFVMLRALARLTWPAVIERCAGNPPLRQKGHLCSGAPPFL